MEENILDKLAAHARERCEEAKKAVSLEDMRDKALSLTGEDKAFPFEKALRKNDISFICECKKASPSKGLIAEDFPYLDIALAYEAAGADAISVLTEQATPSVVASPSVSAWQARLAVVWKVCCMFWTNLRSVCTSGTTAN